MALTRMWGMGEAGRASGVSRPGRGRFAGSPGRLCCLVLCLLASIGIEPAPAQDAGVADAEIRVRPVRFGLGNLARPGSWTGFAVELLDSALEPRDVAITVQFEDADGDRAQMERVVTTNPNRPQTFWVYGRVPHTIGKFDAIPVTVREALEGADGFVPGRVLGRASMTPPGQQVQEWLATYGMLAIVGPRTFGLRQYADTLGAGTTPPFANELTAVTSGLAVSELPDRWQGYAGFETLVWGQASGDFSPQLLSPEQARAIEAWVRRGGHLVIVYPAVGREWVDRVGNPLAPILPRIELPRRAEGASLEPYRPLITEHRDVALPPTGIVHSFAASADAGPQDALPVIAGPEGEVLVVRRIVGTGAVSMIGLDLGDRRLTTMDAIDVESLWHRVLGRRGDHLQPDDLAAGAQLGMAQRTLREFDAEIGDVIAKRGQALQGVLLGFLVFAAYWVLSGPGGFGLLARWKRKQHAWLAFVVAIAGFTAISWLGATILRPKRTNATQLAYLIGVHGQDVQRARSWLSVLVPYYGDATVAVGDADDRVRRPAGSDLLAPWDPPSARQAGRETFPDNRGYRVDARSPSAVRVPTRSTVKQFRADWAGPARWSLPRPFGEPGATSEPRIDLVIEGGAARLDGALVHDLPAPVEDLVVIVNRHQRTLLRPGASLGIAPVPVVEAYSRPEPWPADEVLDLREMTTLTNARDRSAARLYLDNAISNGLAITLQLNQPGVRGGLPERLTAGLLFSQLKPADSRNRADTHDQARRSETHGLDLGVWFTTPCVIVIGHVVIGGDAATPEASPIPLQVDGRPVPSSGRTVVAWVYPLEPSPPAWWNANEPSDEAASDD